jgi:fibronectin type 3 domain-containing protein
VFRGTSANGNYVALNGAQVVMGTMYIDGTASAGVAYFYRVTAADQSGNQSAPSDSATATRLFPDPRRVNAAGGAFTDGQGRVWEADNGFVGGTASAGAYDVLGTTDDALYYARRFGNFNYNLALPDGAYKVSLHFADPTNTVAGKRQFDVFAEGKQILDNFDIAANGGGKAAISRAFNVNVTGGELNLRFATVLDNAIVSAIEIVPIGDTVAPAIPKRPAVSGSQEGVRLDWADNTDADLAGYNVYRSNSAEGTYVKLTTGGPVTASEFTDTTGPSGATVYYRVTAVDAWGNESSPVSVAATRPVDVTPPAPLAGVTAVGSVSGVVLDWGSTAGGDVAGFVVYRLDPGAGSYTRVNATPFTGAMFNDTAAAYDATSAYRVTAVDAAGNESAYVEASAYRPPAPVVGTGLKGEYFDNSNFTNLKLTRTDATVNAFWDSGSPDPSMGADTFSVRWTGQIVADKTEAYTFTVRADETVRLWVNGQLVIDVANAGLNAVDLVSTPVQMVAGERVDIRLEYVDTTGRAGVRLFWQSASTPKAIVPAAALFPAA